jgi:hypothetical protein
MTLLVSSLSYLRLPETGFLGMQVSIVFAFAKVRTLLRFDWDISSWLMVLRGSLQSSIADFL